jgi:hypothetical protein
MATVELKVPMTLGAVSFEAGIHEDVEIVRDWFVDEMEKVGLFIVKEGEILYPSASKKKVADKVAVIEEAPTAEEPTA